MKNTIIDTLYIKSFKWEEIKPSKKYDAYYENSCKLIEKLTDLLNDEGKKLIKEYEEKYIGMEKEACEQHFKEGVRVGARLMLSMLSDD